MAIRILTFKLFFVLFLNSYHLLGNTFYISTNGNDMNEGKIESPFKTLKFAIKKLKEGDSLFIRGGIYFTSETIKPNSNIYIASIKDENVEFVYYFFLTPLAYLNKIMRKNNPLQLNNTSNSTFITMKKEFTKEIFKKKCGK